MQKKSINQLDCLLGILCEFRDFGKFENVSAEVRANISQAKDPVLNLSLSIPYFY